MYKNFSLAVSSLFFGSILCLGIILFTPFLSPTGSVLLIPNAKIIGAKVFIGFLPYWLLNRAKKDYSSSITMLTYFALRIDKDGKIQKLLTPTEEEPGWYALHSGSVNPFLQNAKIHNILLSLAIDSGDIATINSFVTNPNKSASNLTTNILPIMNTYGFQDLNLDIEYTQEASSQARANFVTFVKDVRNSLPKNISLTLEISTVDVIQKQLIDVAKVDKYANHIILMAYDFHAFDSFVTGPIAPLSGAGITSEYDVTTAVQKALQFIPNQKLILGIPLYGYEWETLGAIPRSAVIPGSGVTASTERVEKFLATCATCSAIIDKDAQESYFSYLSSDTNTNHTFFFPTNISTNAKIALANERGLGGLALWALGYEGNTILDPIKKYKGD